MRRTTWIVGLATIECFAIGGMILNAGPFTRTLAASVEELIGLHVILLAFGGLTWLFRRADVFLENYLDYDDPKDKIRHGPAARLEAKP